MRLPGFSFLTLFLAGCAAVPSPTPARYLDVRGLDQPRPCERYYVLIFSSENALKQPRYTHTWATAVRVTDQGLGRPPGIEHHTISWMPATLDVRPPRFYMEPGVNLSLHDTITRVALANDEKIGLWGPYECRATFFTRFTVQKQFMESGKMQYQCIDSVGEAASTGHGSNCIHAVTDMDPAHGRRQYPLTRYGFAAGIEISRRFRELDVFVDSSQTHEFLIPVLGLNAFPIIRGKADDILSPSRSPLIGNR
jgi:hypothetical protein